MNNLTQALKGLENYKDEVLLFVRVGLCFMFIVVHGEPKLFGGPA